TGTGKGRARRRAAPFLPLLFCPRSTICGITSPLINLVTASTARRRRGGALFNQARDSAKESRNMAILFLVLFMILAGLNWFAAWRGRLDIEYIVKPAATAALVLFAAAGGQPSFWLIAALTLCLLGDVFLMLPGNYFLAGLSAFLLGHLAYIGFVSFAT